MWSRLARIRQLQRQISARVQLAVEAEDFGKAEEIYVLQKMAEDWASSACHGRGAHGRTASTPSA